MNTWDRGFVDSFVGNVLYWASVPEPSDCVNGNVVFAYGMKLVDWFFVRWIRLTLNFRNGAVSEVFWFFEDVTRGIARATTGGKDDPRLPRRPIGGFYSLYPVCEGGVIGFVDRVGWSEAEFGSTGDFSVELVRGEEGFEVKIGNGGVEAGLITVRS